MSNIRVYPIESDLAAPGELTEASAAFLRSLEKASGHSFIVSGLDDFRDGDLGLILVQSGGSEARFRKLSESLEGPYYLLTHGSANSLAAALEIMAYIRQTGREGEILTGSLSYVISRLETLMLLKGKLEESRLTRLGVIGRPSDWLIASDVSYQKAKRLFGVDLVDLTTQELIWDYASISAEVPDGRLAADFDRGELNKAYRVYKALKQMIKDHKLAGLALRCFDLLGPLKTTACLGLGLLNAKGVPSACEGDVPALLTMHTVFKVLGEPSFQANVCWVDTGERSLLLAHCTLPLDMAEAYGFDTHFESGIGVGVRGKMKAGPVTVVRLSSDLNRFFCEEGELENIPFREDLCRTQIKVRLAGPVSYFLACPLGNHHMVCYGHHKKELSDYYRMLGLMPAETE